MFDKKITVNVTSSAKLNNSPEDKLISNMSEGMDKVAIRINDGMFYNPMKKYQR